MKLYLQILLLLFLVSCTGNKNVADAEMSSDLTTMLKIDKTQLQIITPNIEIKEKKNGNYLDSPSERTKLREVSLQTVQSMFPNAPYVEVPFLFKDSRTINVALEKELSFKKRKAPKEVLTTGKRYSIYISTNNYFGDLERGVINLFLIDNKRETIQLLNHFKYKHSPLETEKYKRKILKVLRSL